ncbi:hypothetical protein [Pseudoalteromonas sp. OOF1S-7]|uniref:hypothetical protein n=1 Tax=Pseudoalteromonas sp. OOF1S-7 TaxID=2917757 RepID=UPI001EF4C746|nr:hypothetical protein [Pseudoalteromonas sp. OOF1S-7]MCG7536684.1 hypothetical protein [Pseudoalteromonas sp. OOF1S-7]
MCDYLIVETQNDLAGGGCTSGLTLATELANAGKQVAVWLFQDAISLLHMRDKTAILACAQHENITCFVDKFSLQQRGDITLPEEIKAAEIDEFTLCLMNKSVRPIWH